MHTKYYRNRCIFHVIVNSCNKLASYLLNYDSILAYLACKQWMVPKLQINTMWHHLFFKQIIKTLVSYKKQMQLNCFTVKRVFAEKICKKTCQNMWSVNCIMTVIKKKVKIGQIAHATQLEWSKPHFCSQMGQLTNLTHCTVFLKNLNSTVCITTANIALVYVL